LSFIWVMSIDCNTTSNSINADLTVNTNSYRLERCLFLLFSYHLSVVFVTLQDKHNTSRMSVNIKPIFTRQEILPFCLPVSNACTNKLYIFRQCAYTVYDLDIIYFFIYLNNYYYQLFVSFKSEITLSTFFSIALASIIISLEVNLSNASHCVRFPNLFCLSFLTFTCHSLRHGL